MAAGRCKAHLAVAQLHQLQIGHAREYPRSRLIRYDRKVTCGTCGTELVHLSRLPFFIANPNLLEEMIEANFVVRRRRRAAIRSVCQRAIERLARTMLGGVKMEASVSELDAAVGLAGKGGIDGDPEHVVDGNVVAPIIL